MKKILVVEDDNLLNNGICYALKKEGYEIRSAYSRKEAMDCLKESYDLLLLDINLTDGSGRELLEQVRLQSEVPAIFLTAKNTEKDMMDGFDSGCDDYITKPFSMPVLMKKIQALLKRTIPLNDQLIHCGSLVYDKQGKLLKKGEEEIRLTATENRLLELFLSNRNQVLTREQILDKVWDTYENYVDEKALNVNIRRLREKLEDDPKNPAFIKTVFGIGYKWSDI